MSYRTMMLLGALLVFGTALVPSPAPAQEPPPISFLPPVNYAFSAGTNDLNSADWDSDGKLDIAVCNGSNVSVLYGNGDGTFGPPIDHSLGSDINVGPVIGADVNADSLLDLVVTHTPANRVAVLINQGSRAFALPVGYAVGRKPYGVAAGDFNGDGKPDLAVSNDDSHDMCVLLNNGDGTFAPAVFYGGGSFPARIVTADFNGDGRLDLAMSNYVSENVLIYFGNGAGAFTGGGSYSVGSYPAQVVTDDFNGDRILDLATANTFSHSVSVLFGDGAGGFGGRADYPGNTYPHIMRSADLDGDGDPDLATPNNGTDYFTVLRNTGGGILAAPVKFTSGGTNVRTLATGDFNGDGQPDVAVGNEASLTISVFINNSPTPAPTSLTAQVVSSSRIDLSWRDNSPRETGFKIERKIAGGVFQQIATVGANVIAYSDTGLAGATTYVYRVRASTETGDSAYSNEATGTTPPSPPAAPSDLRVTVVSQTRLDLSWRDNSTNETSFEIERKTGGGSFTLIGAVGANLLSFRDIDLNPATTYIYRVRATNAGGDSPYSNEAQETTLPNPPAAPSDLALVVVSQTRIDLSWQDHSSNETGFEVERKTGGGSFSRVGTVGIGGTAFTDNTLIANTSYTYRVRAVNTGGASGYTTEASATTLPNPPASPSSLAANVNSVSQIELSWIDNSDNETSFRIERRQGAGNWEPVATANANATEFLDNGRSPDTPYSYRVRAENAGGASPYASEAGTRIPTGGRLRVRRRLRLPNTPVGGAVTRTLTLRNVGRGPLAGKVGTLPAPFQIISGGEHFSLGPRQRHLVIVEIRPGAPGPVVAPLTITSSDAIRPAVVVVIFGAGR